MSYSRAGKRRAANGKKEWKPKSTLTITITMDVESRRLRVQGPDDLDESMRMLEGAVHLMAKVRNDKANGEANKVQRPRIIRPSSAEAMAVMRRRN